MGNLVATPQWVDVPYFEANALLTGGPDCPDNIPIQALLDRTEYLKGSPEFSGTPKAPTAPAGTNTTQLATTAFAMTAASNAVAGVTIADASETVAGKIEIATSAEVIAGTDTARAITPAGLRSALNASGSAPVYACRAWVNFNGTGTVAIRASGNVSSITDNGTGNYTVNFTTAMPDANYCVHASTERSSGFVNVGSYDSSRVRIATYSSVDLVDVSSAFVSIFR